MWEFLARVEEEFYAAETGFVGLELEAPFYEEGFWGEGGDGVEVGCR